MSLPDNRKETFELLKKWCLGNEDAAEFLIEIAEIARLADDIVDKKESRQRNVCWLVSRLLTRIPKNRFFMLNLEKLEPSLNSALNGWRISDDWRSSGVYAKEIFGFVLRENTDHIILAVAYIIGGHEHAFKVWQEVFEICHAGSDETVEDWVNG